MKIGILGGGISGLASAWLLGPHHQTTLFEKDDRLGGHADTVHVPCGGRRLAVDTGFQYFSSNMYPYFCRLLRILDVPVQVTPQTLTIESRHTGRLTRVTPSWRNGEWRAALRPRILSSLLLLRRAIRMAEGLEASNDWSVSVSGLFGGRGMTDFNEALLYPLLASLWGTSLDQARACSARAMMKFLVHHQPQSPFTSFPFLGVVGGVHTYVAALRRTLVSSAIRTSSRIAALKRRGGEFLVVDGNGGEHAFDIVILATPAHEALRLVKTLPGSERLAEVLSRFQHIDATIAVHSDLERMPRARQAWSTCNSIVEGDVSQLSVWSGSSHRIDVFKSWTTHCERQPRDVHRIRRFKHALMTADHFRAQRALEVLQGEGGLWLGGSYTRDIDSHESGLRSAMDICRRLCPDSTGLRYLLEPETFRRAKAS